MHPCVRLSRTYLSLVSSFLCDLSPFHSLFSCPTVCIKCKRLLLFIYSCDASTFSFFHSSALFLSLSLSLSIVFCMFRYVNTHSVVSVYSLNVTFTRTTHLLFILLFFYFHFYFFLTLSSTEQSTPAPVYSFFASFLQVLLQLSRAITRLFCVNTCVIKYLATCFFFFASSFLITHCASSFTCSFVFFFFFSFLSFKLNFLHHYSLHSESEKLTTHGRRQALSSEWS